MRARAHTHTHTHTLAHALALTHARMYTHTLSLSLSHTCTHTGAASLQCYFTMSQENKKYRGKLLIVCIIHMLYTHFYYVHTDLFTSSQQQQQTKLTVKESVFFLLLCIHFIEQCREEETRTQHYCCNNLCFTLIETYISSLTLIPSPADIQSTKKPVDTTRVKE